MTEAQFEALMELIDAKIALARPGGHNDDHLVDREACAVSQARSLLVDEEAPAPALSDEAFAIKMSALATDGGEYPRPDWPACEELCKAFPDMFELGAPRGPGKQWKRLSVKPIPFD
jgi:hypothetical protein